MKKGVLPLLLALAAGDHPQLGGAPVLLAARVHGAEASQGAALPTPTVKHNKVPGNGYKQGSPLYAKQEQMKAMGDLKAPPPPGGKPESAGPWGWSEDGGFRYTAKKPPTFEEWKAGLWYALYQAVASILLTCVFAALYRKFYTPPKPLRPLDATEGNFKFGLCDFRCGPGDLVICCMSCCCLPIRWSETISHESMKGYGASFWMALLTMLFLGGLYYFTGGLSYLIILALQIFYRQKIRKAYDHWGGSSGATIFYDTMTWCYCCCCAAVQEAREVEQVIRPKGFVVEARQELRQLERQLVGAARAAPQ